MFIAIPNPRYHRCLVGEGRSVGMHYAAGLDLPWAMAATLRDGFFKDGKTCFLGKVVPSRMSDFIFIFIPFHC